MTQRKLPASIFVWPCWHQARAFAIGKQTGGGFHIRKIVWGRLAARTDRRAGEEVRPAIIQVERGRRRA